MALIGELDLDLPFWMLPEILITWSPLVKLMACSDTKRWGGEANHARPQGRDISPVYLLGRDRDRDMW